MKIFLFGYGQMGKEIEKVAMGRGHEIIYKSDPFTAEPFSETKLKSSDVAIEFTTPATAVANITECFKAGIPVICGTTGWYDQMEKVVNLCRENEGTLFYSPNFSIGVNLLFKVNEFLASLMNDQPQYDLSISEIHHTKKKDAPSGTAAYLANTILKNIDRKSKFEVLESGKAPQNKDGQFPVYFSRTDDIAGIHEVEYFSETDRISIRHEAFNRKGLAIGTILATEWVAGRKGIFTMNDLFK